jgi:hypothetical protein
MLTKKLVAGAVAAVGLWWLERPAGAAVRKYGPSAVTETTAKHCIVTERSGESWCTALAGGNCPSGGGVQIPLMVCLLAKGLGSIASDFADRFASGVQTVRSAIAGPTKLIPTAEVDLRGPIDPYEDEPA